MSPNDGLQEAFRKFKLSADIKKSSEVPADSTSNRNITNRRKEQVPGKQGKTMKTIMKQEVLDTCVNLQAKLP